MANLKISQLPEYSGNTSGSYLVMNNSGETITYKVKKENYIFPYNGNATITGSLNLSGSNPILFATGTLQINGPIFQYSETPSNWVTGGTYTTEIQNYPYNGKIEINSWSGSYASAVGYATRTIGMFASQSYFNSLNNNIFKEGPSIYTNQSTGSISLVSMIGFRNTTGFTGNGTISLMRSTDVTGSLVASGSIHRLIGNTEITGSLDVSSSVTSSFDSTFNRVRIGQGWPTETTNRNNLFIGFGKVVRGSIDANQNQYNTAVGLGALQFNISGSDNVGLGVYSAASNTNGIRNIAIGTYAGTSNETGSNNISIGWQANFYGTNFENIAIGSQALQNNGSDLQNVGRNLAIGGQSLLNVTGSRNIGIGYTAGRYETGSNSFYLDTWDRSNFNGGVSGSLLYGNFNSTATNQKLRVNATTTLANTLNIETGGANITGSLNVTGSVAVTGSVQGNVNSLSISSNTASLNLNDGDFFNLQLVSGSATHLNPSNIKPGQTVSIFVNTIGSATMTFPSSVKQISGSSYVPTTTTGIDILTLISKDSSNLYLVNAKNFV